VANEATARLHDKLGRHLKGFVRIVEENPQYLPVAEKLVQQLEAMTAATKEWLESMKSAKPV
jgi:hypothetical protein